MVKLSQASLTIGFLRSLGSNYCVCGQVSHFIYAFDETDRSLVHNSSNQMLLQTVHDRRGEYINSCYVQAVINHMKTVDKFKVSDWRYQVEFKSQRESESDWYIWKGDIVGYLGLDLGNDVFTKAIDFSKKKNDRPLYSILELCMPATYVCLDLC